MVYWGQGPGGNNSNHLPKMFHSNPAPAGTIGCLTELDFVQIAQVTELMTLHQLKEWILSS
jgi:hypothetical protein